jgi:hypothetical protein
VYFNCVRKRISDHLFEQTRIRAYRQAARNHPQGKSLCLRGIAEFIPQPVEQIVDREADDLGTDSADLDLVSVEQRVQNARQGAQRLAEPCNQFLLSLPLDSLRQYAFNQHERLQRLAEVMARSGEKARFRAIRQVCLPLGSCQFVRCAPAFRDVDKGDDDALDALLGAVRQYPADVPGAAMRFDLALDRRVRPQHRTGIAQKPAVGRQPSQLGERPPDIARAYIDPAASRRASNAPFGWSASNASRAPRRTHRSLWVVATHSASLWITTYPATGGL